MKFTENNDALMLLSDWAQKNPKPASIVLLKGGAEELSKMLILAG